MTVAWDPICQNPEPQVHAPCHCGPCWMQFLPTGQCPGRPQLYPGSRKVSDVCDWGYPAPWLDAGMRPGYQAPACPSWGPSASLWSWQPAQCHDNSNAKTFQRKLGIPVFHNKNPKYITIKWLMHGFTCYKFTCHNLITFYSPLSCTKQINSTHFYVILFSVY